MIKNKKILDDLGVDRRNYKWSGTKKLSKINLSELPEYLKSNTKKYIKWLDC